MIWQWWLLFYCYTSSRKSMEVFPPFLWFIKSLWFISELTSALHSTRIPVYQIDSGNSNSANATKFWICLKPTYACVHFGIFQENKHESSLLTIMEDKVFVGKKAAKIWQLLSNCLIYWDCSSKVSCICHSYVFLIHSAGTYTCIYSYTHVQVCSHFSHSLPLYFLFLVTVFKYAELQKLFFYSLVQNYFLFILISLFKSFSFWYRGILNVVNFFQFFVG